MASKTGLEAGPPMGGQFLQRTGKAAFDRVWGARVSRPQTRSEPRAPANEHLRATLPPSPGRQQGAGSPAPVLAGAACDAGFTAVLVRYRLDHGRGSAGDAVRTGAAATYISATYVTNDTPKPMNHA